MIRIVRVLVALLLSVLLGGSAVLAFEIDGPDLTGDIVIGDEVSLELFLTLRRERIEPQ